MTRTIDKKLMSLRHASMLEYQSKVHPFTPTMRELKKLWGLNTTSAVHLSLQRLELAGMVVSRQHGKSKSYFAKPCLTSRAADLPPVAPKSKKVAKAANR